MKVAWKKLQLSGPRGAKIAARVSPWVSPYVLVKRKQTPSLTRLTRKKQGIYLIKKKGGRKILYIGHSLSDLKKTLYRHFQSWHDSTQYRATYPKSGYLIRVILAPAAQIKAMEVELIQKFNPRDAELKYSGMKKPGIKGLGPSLSKSDDVPF